jgi:hypothetical protein
MDHSDTWEHGKPKVRFVTQWYVGRELPDQKTSLSGAHGCLGKAASPVKSYVENLRQAKIREKHYISGPPSPGQKPPMLLPIH